MPIERKITITVTGPQGIGKQHLILRLEKLLTDELKAQAVSIPAHVAEFKELLRGEGIDIMDRYPIEPDNIIALNVYELKDVNNHV